MVRAHASYQTQLGLPWFVATGWPIYQPWKLFSWWFYFEAYAPEVFDKAGILAAASGFMGCAAAIADGSTGWSRHTVPRAGP